MQDLNDMVYFAEVVDKGGFAAAGRALGIPKSRLSRRIAELEDGLGVRLLHRTTRKLSLTEAGELYHRHAAGIRDQAQAAADAVAQVQSEPRGTIRVAVPVTLAQSTIGVLMPAFLARYPHVRVDMRVSNKVVDLVEEGIDVALRVRQTLDESGSLVIKNFGLTRTLLLASPGLLARQGKPESTDDLVRMDTINMTSDARATWQLVGPGNEIFAFHPQPRYIADDLLTLKFAARCGTGICVLPEYMCREEIQKGELVEALPGWAPRPGIFHAVFPSRRGIVPAVRKFLDFLGDNVTADGEMIDPRDAK